MIILKYNFFVFSIKKYFFTILILIFLIGLLSFSTINIQAAKDGLILWAEAVVPSLFPFFVASSLLCQTNIISIFGKYLGKLMRPLFNVPGESTIALIIGAISGYPVGAKVVCQLLNQKVINKDEAERLVAFCNNSGPLFIIGTIGIVLYNNKYIGFLLLFTHILSAISVGIIYKFWSPNTYNKKISKLKNNYNQNNYFKEQDSNSFITFRNFGEILGNSIKSSIQSILQIGGFIVIFSVILSLIKSTNFFNFLSSFDTVFSMPNHFFESIFSGILELTNGVKLLSTLNLKTLNILFTAFLLGFGGVSVLLQVFSIITKEHLSIRPYLIGKILQGIIATVYTYIFLCFL